jgi:hypothetical protein
MATAKKYVLLDHMAPTAPIYMNVNGNKMRLNTKKRWRPYLQVSVIGDDDTARVIRLKLSSNTIDQEEQIKRGIPANEKFSEAERQAILFRNGVLITDVAIVQKFLDEHPQNEAFKGTSPDRLRPSFKVEVESEIAKNKYQGFKRNLQAAQAIDKMNDEQAEEMLIRVYGSFYEIPVDLESKKNALVEAMDSNPDVIDEILKGDNINIDDEISILIGKLVQAKLLSFDAIENNVSVKRNNQWIAKREISSEYDQDHRTQVLAEFLATTRGKGLYDELNLLLEQHQASKKPDSTPPDYNPNSHTDIRNGEDGSEEPVNNNPVLEGVEETAPQATGNVEAGVPDGAATQSAPPTVIEPPTGNGKGRSRKQENEPLKT